MADAIPISFSPRDSKWQAIAPSMPSSASMASSSSLSLAMSSLSFSLTPSADSPSSSLPVIAASPYDTLRFNTAAEISFEIQDVVEVVHAPPIPNSVMPPITENQVKIDDGRETCIPAAEMTSSMQMKLRKFTADEIKQNFRVTRSDEVGSRGLYTLTKPEWTTKARPKSLTLAAGLQSPFAGLKTPLWTPGSALSSATKGLFGLLTPLPTPSALRTPARDTYFG